MKHLCTINPKVHTGIKAYFGHAGFEYIYVGADDFDTAAMVKEEFVLHGGPPHPKNPHFDLINDRLIKLQPTNIVVHERSIAAMMFNIEGYIKLLGGAENVWVHSLYGSIYAHFGHLCQFHQLVLPYHCRDHNFSPDRGDDIVLLARDNVIKGLDMLEDIEEFYEIKKFIDVDYSVAKDVFNTAAYALLPTILHPDDAGMNPEYAMFEAVDAGALPILHSCWRHACGNGPVYFDEFEIFGLPCDNSERLERLEMCQQKFFSNRVYFYNFVV